MKLLSGKKEIGSIYCNIQISKEAFSESITDVLDKLKEGSLIVTLDKSKFKIASYRRVHQDENSIYLEGAELASN